MTKEFFQDYWFFSLFDLRQVFPPDTVPFVRTAPEAIKADEEIADTLIC
jgi:hypothetical protein